MNKCTKWLYMALMFAVSALIMTGCGGTKGVAASQIMSDIENSYAFQQYRVELSDVTIIKRQTDVTNKTDDVYVSVYGKNNDYEVAKNYQLTYELYNEGWILENIRSYYDANYPERIATLRGPRDYIRDDLLDFDITLDDSNIAYCFDKDRYSNYYGYEVSDWKQLTKYDGKGTTDSYVRTAVFKSDYFNEILEQTIMFEFDVHNLTWGAHWDEVIRVELNEGILGTWKTDSGWEFRITSYTEDTCYVEYCSKGSTEFTPGTLQVGEPNGYWVYLTWTDSEERTFNHGSVLEGLCIRGNSLYGNKIELSVEAPLSWLDDGYLEKVT